MPKPLNITPNTPPKNRAKPAVRIVLDLFGDPGEMFHGCVHCLLDAALNANRVRARSDKSQTFPVNRLGEQCGSHANTWKMQWQYL